MLSFRPELPTSSTEAYVESQRAFNSVHRDGTSRGFIEESMEYARAFCVSLRDRYGKDWIPNGVLDVGCRLGYCMEIFIDEFPAARVVGVDLVPEFVEQASIVSDAIIADMHDLPFADDEFDCVFCSQTLEHCYDPIRGAAELLRVCRNDLLVTVPLEGYETTSFQDNLSHYACSPDPLDWHLLFRHPELKLCTGWRGLRQTRYFNMHFTRGLL